MDTITEKWDTVVALNKEIDDLYHKVAEFYNLSDSEFWILYSLYSSKTDLTQKEICTNWAYSKQTINSAIKKLLDLKYIEIDKNIISNKNKKIHLTSLGKEVADKTISKVIQAEEQSFSKIKESDLDIVIKVLNSSLNLFKKELEKIYRSSED